jgi:hypothetical protein
MRGLVVSFRAMLAAPERVVAAGPDSGRLNRAQSEGDDAG